MRKMNEDSKIALAGAVRLIFDWREASYAGDFTYRLTYADAADELMKRGEVDEDTAFLAVIMLDAGYCEFHDWCDHILGPREQAA